jgi:hypothetical protein
MGEHTRCVTLIDNSVRQEYVGIRCRENARGKGKGKGKGKGCLNGYRVGAGNI